MHLSYGVAKSKNISEADSLRSFLQPSLAKLGYVGSISKCEWQLRQSIVLLGFMWNTQAGVIKVLLERTEKLNGLIEFILENNKLRSSFI